MDGSSLTPRAWLRRLDFALAAPPPPARIDPGCHDCDGGLDETPSPALAWCAPCRRVYFHATGRLLCEVPAHWRQERLFEYWERAMEGLRDREHDLAFARFLCDQAGLCGEAAADAGLAAKRDQARIGRLALAHRLLSRGEVAWVLHFQRSARAHRRRCFGEIACSLGYWKPNVAARLLSVQAERRRGLAEAVAQRLGVSREQMLAAERAFFGLDPDRSCHLGDAPFDALMAA